MPYIFTTSQYPSHLATAVGERYLKALTKYPPDATLGDQIVPAAVTTNSEGIRVLGISEIKEGKLEEALTRAGNIAVMFHDIEGFELSVDVWSTLTEAMTSIGMSPPE